MNIAENRKIKGVLDGWQMEQVLAEQDLSPWFWSLS